MIEVCNVLAFPLANAIRCALSVSKTGILALDTGSLISVTGLNLNPHELMGYLINLSFEPVKTPKAFFVSLTSSDKTLRDIANRIDLPLIETPEVDLDIPILSLASGVRFKVLVGTYTFDNPLTSEYVREYSIRYEMDIDTLVCSSLPMHQPNRFLYKIEPISETKSKIQFLDTSEKEVFQVLKKLHDITVKQY